VLEHEQARRRDRPSGGPARCDSFDVHDDHDRTQGATRDPSALVLITDEDMQALVTLRSTSEPWKVRGETAAEITKQDGSPAS